MTQDAEQDPADLPVDPQAMADLVAAQRARTAAELSVDARLVFGAWGLAWLIGLGLMWASFTERLAMPFWLAGALFGALLVVAAVITVVHSMRRGAGVSGVSSRQGAMYGWTWFAVFVGDGAVMATLGRMDVGPEASLLVGSALPALLVAALYMVGGALWSDRVQFTLGAWIAGSTTVGALAGSPTILLVMSVAGGGGMLVAALLAAVRRRDGAVDR